MKTIDARFIIKKSGPGMGKGLFANKRIKKGEFILEYIGEKIPTSVADKMTSRYLFEINEKWTIDGSTRSNTARYINHACSPNTSAEVLEDKIMIFAVREIRKGEEITIDYDTEYFDEFIRPIGCRCAQCISKSNRLMPQSV
ncbi:MAG: SET domain-containing protein [Candidatus Kaiserbacteria bacterium]|nr:SET domain-containing protein [Candidatus Kaiserbacteria bacterium]